MLSLIVARARNGAIGRDNTIPWHAPEDLRFFQRETLGGALIMGRRTWESLPVKPLPKRLNIVVTAHPGPDIEGAVFARLDEAQDIAHAGGHSRVYGIGGAGIYRAFLPFADRLLITEVDLEVPDADVFFPEIDPQDWIVRPAISLRTDLPACRVVEYLRRRS